MKLAERIAAIENLGKKLHEEIEGGRFEEVAIKAGYKNGWFTLESVNKSVDAVLSKFLNGEKIAHWIKPYEFVELDSPKKIGLLLAGNIPFVGFHDILCCFIAGQKAMIKYSQKDEVLIPYLLSLLIEIEPKASPYFEKVERFNGLDAVIATGSNNSSRYFDYYFRNMPSIIRKNRNSVAILTGEETEDDLQKLAIDVYEYFGLGCRNVSKLYIPKGYDVTKILKAFETQEKIADHHKYKNNYDYNYAIHLLNKDEFLANGNIILLKSDQIASRISCLHYAEYVSKEMLINHLSTITEQVQCYICKQSIQNISITPLGNSQSPELWDYADDVDTLNFLIKL